MHCAQKFALPQQNHANIILGALSYGQTHIVKIINKSLIQANIKYLKESQCSKAQWGTKYNRSKSKIDVLAKIHFIGHNSPVRKHLVQPIGLNKPKYLSKEFQKVKVV